MIETGGTGRPPLREPGPKPAARIHSPVMARRPALPNPSDVVSGRARVTVDQLFALIHDVNPTDKGLSPRAESDGYALKSRLQSVLIRQHSDLLVVERRSGDERVVSLRHRIAGRDACHAVLPSLDDDARRWVETELALAERTAATLSKKPAPTAGAPTPVNPGSAGSGSVPERIHAGIRPEARHPATHGGSCGVHPPCRLGHAHVLVDAEENDLGAFHQAMLLAPACGELTDGSLGGDEKGISGVIGHFGQLHGGGPWATTSGNVH